MAASFSPELPQFFFSLRKVQWLLYRPSTCRSPDVGNDTELNAIKDKGTSVQSAFQHLGIHSLVTKLLAIRLYKACRVFNEHLPRYIKKARSTRETHLVSGLVPLCLLIQILNCSASAGNGNQKREERFVPKSEEHQDAPPNTLGVSHSGSPGGTAQGLGPRT